MNIDKDIKILKDLMKLYEKLSKNKVFLEKDREFVIRKRQAIENVLSDRETWKKIAEKLAEEVKKEILHYDVQGINYCELSYENDYTKHGKCSKHNDGFNCIECIIDWARKEVEEDE